MTTQPKARPFLKWAGGKRKLIPELQKHVPARFSHYFEPFVGGGAMFFEQDPARATLSDVNAELVTTWKAVQRYPEEVIRQLRGMRNTSEFFYETRKQNPAALEHPWEVAARMIYLNKTCFNGLYRVNQQGIFNVPFGSYANPLICDEVNIRAVSKALQGVSLRCGSFEYLEDYSDPIAAAWAGDFVYFDPPYVPISDTANFTAYTSGGFGWSDHVRLRDVALELKLRGVHVLLSNADTPAVRSLYRDGFEIEAVKAPRSIACKGGSRVSVGEVIIW